MKLQFIENPRPIKLNETEQKAMDQIIKNLWDKIFSKSWQKSTAMVGNTVIFDERVMVTAFGEKPRSIRVLVKGRKKGHNKWTSKGFGFTSGSLRTWYNRDTGKVSKQELEVDFNGYAKKDSFSKMYKEEPYKFFSEYVGFLSTIRHELIHAKDPVAQKSAGLYGTSTINQKYGYMQYVNDPARLEIRSHMGEWDILFTEIENIIKNKDKDEYHQKVFERIKELLCILQYDFYEDYYKAETLFDFLTIRKFTLSSNIRLGGVLKSFVPEELANRLKLYHDFSSVSDKEAKKVARAYERSMRKYWERFYSEKMDIWKELQQMKKNEFTKLNMPQKMGENYKKAKNEANRIAKKKFREKYPNASLKKPKLKTKFTEKEMQNILDNRQKNYQESIQTIYTLMKKKGLFDPSLCSTEVSIGQRAREKRAMTLLKRDKIVLYSLMKRFENLR